MALIEIKGVSKIYRSGEHEFPAGVLVLKWLTVALASEYEMAITLGPLTYLKAPE